MTALERRWAGQILSAFAPASSPGLAPRTGEVDWMGALALLRARSTRLAALGLRVAIWMVALAPLWHTRVLRTIHALAPEARAKLLSSLLSHRSFAVRELTLLLKLSASLAMFASDSLRARSGYDRHVERPIALGKKPEREAREGLPSSVPPPEALEALAH